VKVLRERGIYRTPEGTEVVASRARHSIFQTGKAAVQTGLGNIYFLFSRYAWAFHARPDYMVDEGGLVLPHEEKAAWHVRDLIDTGHTAGDH
jgi:hypothetical protein